MPAEARPPFALPLVATVYLISLLLSASSYGDPIPFMGRFYTGKAAACLVFVDCLVSLYLAIGTMKRQRLTVWLIIGYNLLDLVSALLNLALIPLEEYARVSQVAISQDAVFFDTLAAGGILLFISVYVFRKRRYFYNRSPYLF
ncbi:hypothetical protein [Geomonas sp.]|uniref:hypothetical protein n=1 Tax=Geomonas sp. TaxID=2651584 RepID=UPI002B473692|nr:hypothetical protein [Geomonas sp.]HJV37021.1 hypothetical protein [Geomonas sp.]